ncbi:S8 family serine peptidase [Stenotrophomonas sp.]|uniref:S8 family serine peptidase n=1 Tax=Stenotrophomonas sp. TaxID=69392 RepID=UPI0028AD8D24|nr:S8 family serine peptidase [Stenotrophomonas sp.]
MKKKTQLGVAIAGVVLMASIGVPAASAAGIGPAKVRGISSSTVDVSGSYRFVVKYRAGASELRDTATLNRGLGAAASRAGLDRAVAKTSRSAAQPAASATLMRRMAAPGWNVIKTSRALNAQEAANFVRELKANPAVERAEIDQMYQRLADISPSMTPTDPNYAQYQWNFSNATSGVRAPQAWDISQGEGVVVAVIDTGITQGNPDLQNNVIPGYDMISDKRVSRRDTDARVAGGWDLGDWVEANYCTGWATTDPHAAEDSSWHGSHVSGTVAQETNNGKGLAGLAYKAKVMPIRVLGSCGGFGSDISDGIIWAAGGEVPGLPLNTTPAEVINMSLGSRQPSSCPAEYQDAIDLANSKGSIVVVAAGNSNGNAASYTMSSCNNVISVGATGYTGGKASYSNYGARVDLSAPGGNGVEGTPNGYIWQVMNGGAKGPEADNWVLGGMGGTSMASPHVAAAVAMVQSVVDTPLTWTQMRDLLKQTATPFPVAIPASTPIGAGILNINAALVKATTPPCDPNVDDCGPVATPLTNKVAVTGLAGSAGSEAVYSFQAEAGKVLTFMTYGGSGDVSLYVSFDEVPTSSEFDAKSTRAGNSETVRVNKPVAGTYYVKVVGAASFAGVSLVARQ